MAPLKLLWLQHDFDPTIFFCPFGRVCGADRSVGLQLLCFVVVFLFHAWVCCEFARLCTLFVFTSIQDEPQEIIKPVPITHPAPSSTYTKPSTQPSSAYNKVARPFGATAAGSLTREASPKVASIPSESSAFTPAAPSQPPQPPFPLKSSFPSSSNSSPAATVVRSSPARTAFTSSSASPSSSNSSSPARATSSQPAAPPSSVYNTPINLYSNVNACEVAMGQRRGLLESQGLSEHFNG